MTERLGFSRDAVFSQPAFVVGQRALKYYAGQKPGNLDADALAHAADVCDEAVATTTIAGTEPRYTCQGVIDCSETVEDNAKRFVQAMAGDMIQQGGSFVINAGEYEVPTFTIDEDMLAGGIVFSSLRPRTARAKRPSMP